MKIKKISKKTTDFSSENIEKLSKIFPEVLTEGKVDFEKLKLLLGEDIEDSNERYGLTWNGKSNAMKIANLPTDATLHPLPEKSINWDTTENLYIEGDNLEVLKLLQKPYHKGIKLIYIDPPYNTGKDFIYKDNFVGNIQNYYEKTGQIDSDGNHLQINKEVNGRFHTDWLNMMYPRVKLAWNLLSNDGVFFVNLSDAEAFNMKKICDEIFYEKNFLADISWNSTKSVTNTAIISDSVTHTLVYFKDKEYFTKHREEFRLPDTEEGFENPDNDPRGPWKADPFQVEGVRKNQLYPITNPNTGKVYYPNEGNSWKNEFNKFQELYADNRIVFGKTGEGGPQRKRFLFEAKERGRVSKTLWADIETTSNGTNRIKKLFGDTVFSNPKPVQLLERIIQLGGNKDGIVLDFFSGSATAAEAVLKMNKEDGGNRKFILVQLPENLDESLKTSSKDAQKVLKKAIKYLDNIKKPHYLTEIGEERIRLAINDLGLSQDPKVGFKVFKLTETNFKKWDKNPNNLKEQIELFANPFKENATLDGILYEIALKHGLKPNFKVEKIRNNEVTLNNINEGELLVVLDDKISTSIFEGIEEKINENTIIILNDNGFDTDNDKLNLLEYLSQKGIDKSRIYSV